MMRATRVGLCCATPAADILLIFLFCYVKFDMLLDVMSIPGLSAAATVLFSMAFMQGIQMLAKVE